MEKQEIKTKLKFVLILLLIMSLVLLLVVQAWLYMTESFLTLSSVIYWLTALVWVILLILYKLKSTFSMFVAFILLIISAVLSVFGLSSFGETIMRLSLIGWLLGIVQALLEYRKEHG